MSGYTYWSGVTILDANGVPVPTSGTTQGASSAGAGGTLVQGVATSGNPVYGNSTINPLSLTPNGALRMALYNSSGTPAVIETAGNLLVRVVASTTGGVLIGRIMSAATTNATSLKATAGTLYGISLFNSGAAAVFVKLYNKASAPVVGTDVPVWTIAIGAGQGVNLDLTQGMAFATGIAYAITNLVADSDTTAVALNQVTGALLYL